MSCLMSCCAWLTCGCCSSVASGISKRSARLAYCGLFGASLIFAWILREVAAPLLEKIPCSSSHTKEWYQMSMVLRDQNDKRDGWHHGGWIAKMIIWLLLIIFMLFVPNVVITIYGFLSKFGAGLFLLVQVVILLDFTHTWNDSWVEKDEQKWFCYSFDECTSFHLLLAPPSLNSDFPFRYIALLTVSVGSYIAAFVLSGILFIWFNPSGHDCGLNIFFIVMTMILAFVFGVIAVHPQVNASLLPASVISVYCAYVCYTGLSSEPRNYACNGLHKSSAVSTSTLVLGMLTTVLSVLYSALRAGSSTTFLSPPSSPRAGAAKPLLESEDMEAGKGKSETEARPVSYSYTFFHLIFALASMYAGMLLSGWTSSSESSDLIDVGWTSVWVRICTEWVTAGLYVWSLLAPLLLPDREFS
ncbi:Serine incorporator 3-like protein [Drosera capensis]